MVHGVTKSQTQLRMYTHTHTHTHTPTLLSSTVGLSGRNLQSRSVGSRLYSPLINYYYFGKTQVSHQWNSIKSIFLVNCERGRWGPTEAWQRLGSHFLLPSSAQAAPVVKEPACRRRRCERLGFDPWIRRSLGGENSILLQYSCLENLMDRGAWWVPVHGVTQSWTQLSNLATAHLNTVKINLDEERVLSHGRMKHSESC